MELHSNQARCLSGWVSFHACPSRSCLRSSSIPEVHLSSTRGIFSQQLPQSRRLHLSPIPPPGASLPRCFTRTHTHASHRQRGGEGSGCVKAAPNTRGRNICSLQRTTAASPNGVWEPPGGRCDARRRRTEAPQRGPALISAPTPFTPTAKWSHVFQRPHLCRVVFFF